jgi:hypothetical protein
VAANTPKAAVMTATTIKSMGIGFTPSVHRKHHVADVERDFDLDQMADRRGYLVQSNAGSADLVPLPIRAGIIAKFAPDLI